ncbi:hypothetical protein [Ancylobacter defluvii]|uniref:Uncharacterized protein n=1 Tax=Ancylobacter defluvii TaxID=1282440 RepID=A0A9W6JXI9_9HYPH|nr:hypothetical protein [Ancylobacter defluvii]MBS7586429.1 hypothetical protein [Ancylobacter defluvii]GLK85710.1 hypothetical protein GCM10017653_37800 [Ancylobacter defluvii]
MKTFQAWELITPEKADVIRAIIGLAVAEGWTLAEFLDRVKPLFEPPAEDAATLGGGSLEPGD